MFLLDMHWSLKRKILAKIVGDFFTKKKTEKFDTFPHFIENSYKTTGHFLIPLPVGAKELTGARRPFGAVHRHDFPHHRCPIDHGSYHPNTSPSERVTFCEASKQGIEGFLVSFLEKIEIGGSCCELSKIGETKQNPFRFRMFNPIIQSISVFNESNCSPFRFVGHANLHPGRLTWNLKITQLKRKIIFQTIIFRFHVNLPGCREYAFFTQHFTFRTSPVSNNPQL